MTSMQPSGPAARLPHADLASPHDMATDCAAAGRHLRLERVARSAVEPAPSIYFDDYPREVPKREINVSEAAARIAGALHLHLD